MKFKFKSAHLLLGAIAGVLLIAIHAGRNVPRSRPVAPAVVIHSSAVALPVDGRNRYERAQDACLLIQNADGSSGSGFSVQCGKELVVWTASHVVDTVNETRIVQVIRSEGVKVGEVFFNASVIARDKESDLAVLWIQHAPPNYFTPVKFAGGAVPRVGSPVYHAGNFRGKVFDRSVSRGIVSQTGVRSPAGERWTWKVTDQADIHVIYGSSGGPLFDENQNILGLIVGLSPYVPGIAFFVPTRAVFSFAEEKNLMWAVSGSFAPSEAELFKLAKSAEVTPPEE